MNGFFITGTDTDVGKTILTALLLAELHRRGVDVVPMKPVQSGTEEGSADLAYSMALAGLTASPEEQKKMVPYCFGPPCSPHLAAEMAGVEIKMKHLLQTALDLGESHDALLVEGAGGVLVPLNRQEKMVDLMKKLGLSVLLAARPSLGTINHTLLSIEVLRAHQVPIAGIVFIHSTPTPAGFIEEDNANIIAHFSEVPVLGTIPYCAELQKTPPPCYSDLPLPLLAEIEKITENAWR
jgi:dethiobiotin synthetase